MARAIYKITNTVNGKFYVGSSVNTRDRFKRHKRLLKRNKHHSAYLQNAWNKHGAEAFVFHVIEIIPEWENLQAAEDVWLKEHVGQKHCYNVGTRSNAPWRGVTGKDMPNYGKPVSEETRQKIRDSINEKYKDPNYQPRVGTKHSPESRAKMSAGILKAVAEGRAGCFIPSKETRQKMSQSLMGNKNSEGREWSPEECEAIRQRMLGNQNFLNKHHSDETRAKMGKTLIEVTTGKEFAVMNDAAKFYNMPNLASIIRSIKSGEPLSKGPNSGLLFAYADGELPKMPVSEYLPTRSQAKAAGDKYYFTGKPCNRGHIAKRVVKGTCTECQKEDWQKENKKRSSLPKSAASKAAGKRYYLRNIKLVKARATQHKKELK